MHREATWYPGCNGRGNKSVKGVAEQDQPVNPGRGLALRAAIDPEGRIRAAWRFVLGMLVVILANLAGAFVASGAGHGRRFELLYRPLSLVLALAGFVLLAKVADGVNEGRLRYLGLPAESRLRDIGLGLLIGFSMILAAVAAIGIGGHLTFKITFSHHSIELALVELFILATGAMMEEVMFRGYPFQRLVESIGAVGALVVLSGLFGLAHFMNPHVSFWAVVNTAAVGVLLGVAYLRTRSLWMPIGIHFAWNTALGFIFGLPVSGLRTFSVVVRSKAEGPLWLTGGSYGIEASATGTTVVVLGTVALFLLQKQRSKFVSVPA